MPAVITLASFLIILRRTKKIKVKSLSWDPLFIICYLIQVAKIICYLILLANNILDSLNKQTLANLTNTTIRISTLVVLHLVLLILLFWSNIILIRTQIIRSIMNKKNHFNQSKMILHSKERRIQQKSSQLLRNNSRQIYWNQWKVFFHARKGRVNNIKEMIMITKGREGLRTQRERKKPIRILSRP